MLYDMKLIYRHQINTEKLKEIDSVYLFYVCVVK
jgi:hypothetical protein